MNRIPRLQEASVSGPGGQCRMKPCCKGNTVILEMCRGLWMWKGVEGGNSMAVVLCHWHAKCSSWTGATRSSSVGAALRIFMISSCGLVSVASRDLVFALGDHAFRCFMSKMWRSSDNSRENITVVGVVSLVTVWDSALPALPKSCENLQMTSPRCAQFVHEICATWLQDIALAAGFSSLRPEIGEKSSGRNPNGWCQKKSTKSCATFFSTKLCKKTDQTNHWIHNVFKKFVDSYLGWQARKVQTDQLRVAWPRAGRSQALRGLELSNVAMSKECVFMCLWWLNYICWVYLRHL